MESNQPVYSRPATILYRTEWWHNKKRVPFYPDWMEEPHFWGSPIIRCALTPAIQLIQNTALSVPTGQRERYYFFCDFQQAYRFKPAGRLSRIAALFVPEFFQIDGKPFRQPGLLCGQGNVVALHGICQGGGARGGRGPLNQHFQEVLHNAAVSAAVAL